MSRKAIDQQQPSECRQAVWDWIRETSKIFTVNDIAMDVRLSESSIRDYLTGLVNAGYLITELVTLNQTPVRYYKLVRDTGIDAPRVRKNGALVTMGQGRRQMWNALQVLKRFTAFDLAFNASTEACPVAESEAKHYIQMLHHANYLKLLTPGKPGHKPGTGKKAVYTLIPAMWTGPQPPQVQRTRQVYDPNLRKVVWSRVEGGAE